MSSNKPFPSSDLDVFKENSLILDNFVNSQENEYPDRFARKRPTITGIIKEAFNVRTDISNMNETLIGQSRWDVVPKNTSLSLGGDNGALNKQAQALFNRTVMLKVHAKEALRRTYLEVGLNLVDGSFEEGGTLNTVTDVLLEEKTGKVYSWSGSFPKVITKGTLPASEVEFVDKSFTKTKFNNIQEMVNYPLLEPGQKVSTGSSSWFITKSTKGIPCGNYYAISLNGVWVDDAGADSTGVNDSYDAVMYVINKYNYDLGRRFSVNFNHGNYKFLKGIELTNKCSFIKINGNGALLEAHENMESLLSCPAITGIEISKIGVGHKAGVVITNAMIHINTTPGSAKTTRNVITDIYAGGFTGASYLLRCDKMWESKIGRVRVDRDVENQTGNVIGLRSCVNLIVEASEIGYCGKAWVIGSHPDVQYGCEGITFNGGVTAFAKTPISIERGTAIRLLGMVLDFCETSGPEFSNGSDITMESCWIANTAESNTGWNGFITLPTCHSVKILSCHFVNNSGRTSYCGSLNSPRSTFIGNTAEGCQSGFRYNNAVQEFGNASTTPGGVINRFVGSRFELINDYTSTTITVLGSGINTNVQNQLLQRFSLTAPRLNGNNTINFDHYQGTYNDQPILQIGWNDVYKYKLNFVTGNFEILNPGSGLVLVSPDGTKKKLVRLSNAGVLELI